MSTMRLVLIGGMAGDHDGLYDIVAPKDYGKPEFALGEHSGTWAEDSYTVVEVVSETSYRAGIEAAAKVGEALETKLRNTGGWIGCEGVHLLTHDIRALPDEPQEQSGA